MSRFLSLGYGLIPAHAGKTLLVVWLRNSRRAHPRSRGENCNCHPHAHLCSGSSPLTRGKRMEQSQRKPQGWLIPAHAGKTIVQTMQLKHSGAHPRSRGENTSSQRTDTSHMGSSPLTRGKRAAAGATGGASRLIPAHAGKTTWLSHIPASVRAHPRSRGENSPRGSKLPVEKGSSPLTRGKLDNIPAACELGGLIPAHAGKTTTSYSLIGKSWAHPRSRGENRATSWGVRSRRGSSPLTRGKHHGSPHG